MATNENRATTGSVEELEADALRYTKDFVHHLWARDFNWCVNRVSNDFIMIGSKNEHLSQSKQDFANMLEALGDDFVRSSVTDESYNAIPCGETHCGTCGRYLVLSPTDNEHISAQWYRCTFLWRKIGRKILLSHLHLSVPTGLMSDEAGYPIVAGTEAYRYMKSLMRMGSSRKNVSLYDTDGTLHWIHPSQIIYLEANRKRTVVHCMTKDIVVPAVIRDTVEMVAGKIIRVHRSYAVNRDHIVELKAGRLLLDDGTQIAIPAKRIADVRARLTGEWTEENEPQPGKEHP